MRELRFLLLGLVICLASGVKAQFYDSADDIYYYVKYVDDEFKDEVIIFNFDGQKACRWNASASSVKSNLSSSPSFYEDKVETTEYDLRYISGNTYRYKKSNSEEYDDYTFSYDRSTLTKIVHYQTIVTPGIPGGGFNYSKSYKEWRENKYTYKRVEKSFFKIGRSRTPSSTMYE